MGTDQRPSICRMVHYRSYGTPGGEYHSECRAAIITEVYDSDEVGLCVANPGGIFFNRCQHDEDTKAGGTWHFPERV